MKHLLRMALAIIPALISADVVFAGDAANQPARPATHYFPDFSGQANMGFRDDVAR